MDGMRFWYITLLLLALAIGAYLGTHYLAPRDVAECISYYHTHTLVGSMEYYRCARYHIYLNP